jgi:2-polyprenyl-3-methyl-5-hydroxy-6-metoxy-1,4-benzoquinol methylase
MTLLATTIEGGPAERLRERALRAAGDPRIDAARAVLAELAPGRRAVAAALAAERARGLDALADLARRAHARYLELVAAAARRTPLARIRHLVDRRLATDEPEFNDDAAAPEALRREVIEGLARFNRLVLAYRTFAALLAPLAAAAARAAPSRPVRILELASGHGEVALYLAAWGRARGLRLEVTGSDIGEDYVRLGTEKAARRGLPVRYERLDALALDLEDGAYDIVVNTQTLHHFPPPAVARLFAESTRVGRAALFIDAVRGLANFVLVAGLTKAFFSRPMSHDAVISVRKMYAASELLLLAGLGPAAGRARIFARFPGYSVVRFEPG